MKLKVIGSSSAGNGYILYNEQEALLIEAGTHLKDALLFLKEHKSEIKGCIVTHEHGDHAKYVNEVLDHAIDVYATEGTCKAMKVKSRIMKPKAIKKNDGRYETATIGGFQVLPFSTEHDAAEPCGYIVRHADIGKLLFVTDTHYVANRFKGINHFMVECNYDHEKLEARDIPDALKRRIRQSHMSIDTCMDLIHANEGPEMNTITLIHLSEESGNPSLFKRVAEASFSAIVNIAEPGLEVELYKDTPF